MVTSRTIKLVLDKSVNDRLEELKQLSGNASDSMVIARALAVYEAVTRAKREGRMVAIQDGDRMWPLEIR